jgi:hypothetical protein
MALRLESDYIDADELLGPLPDFSDIFENFFVQKAFISIYSDLNPYISKPSKYVVISFCFKYRLSIYLSKINYYLRICEINQT